MDVDKHWPKYYIYIEPFLKVLFMISGGVYYGLKRHHNTCFSI